MGLFTSEIFRIKSIAFVLCFSLSVITYSAEEGIATATMKNFVKPQFNDQTKKLEYILTGTDAKTSGALVQINNVRLELIGGDGKTVKAVITTPQAFYNQATNFVISDKSVKYTSMAFDAEGVGFDASQVTQTMHIRKQVKMTLKSARDIGNGLSGNLSPSMFSLGTAIDSEGTEARNTESKHEIKNNSDTKVE